MITLTLSAADALTMLQSGRLTDAAKSDLHAAILSLMVGGSQEDVVELKVWSKPLVMSEKIDAIKIVRNAVSDSYPGRLLGLREAKDWVEGNASEQVVVVLPRVKANEIAEKLNRMGWRIVKVQASEPLSYQRSSY